MDSADSDDTIVGLISNFSQYCYLNYTNKIVTVVCEVGTLRKKLSKK